jgi:hypothetical protein
MYARLAGAAWLALLGAFASGCLAASTAPEGWRRSQEDVQRVALGSWTRVESRPASPSSPPSLVLDGELIAADGKSVVLAKNGHVTVVPVTCANRMTVAAFEPGVAEAIAIGSVGGLSTLSHGFFLVISAPIWLVTTMGATWAQSGAGTLEKPRNPGAWARFPQGLPPGFLEQAGRVTMVGADCLVADRPEAVGGGAAP